VTRRLRGAKLVLVAALVLVLAAGVFTGVTLWRGAHRSEFERSLELLPADTLRASWTDWSGVRATLGVDEPTEPDAIREFTEKAFGSDLSAASSIDESAVALAINYGFSPANAEWELFGQSRDGAVMLLKLPESVDLGQVEDRLESLGYTPPTTADGVWSGGEDVVARIDPTITPELEYLTVLADDHLIVSSDGAGYLETAVKAAKGDGGGLDGDALHGLAGQVDEPLAATAFVGDFACEALAMSQADPEQQSAATNLVEDAGGINPVRGLVVAAYADLRLRVAMAFESNEQAEANANARARLAQGPAPGQGEDFSDLFGVTKALRDGSTVVLDLQAVPDSYALSNLISGPVLFESC